MKIKTDEGFCTSCHNYSEYKYGEEDFSQVTKDLPNYEKYKDIYVYMCPKCDFISTDITGVEGVLYDKITKSLEYKNALNNAFLEGKDELVSDLHSQQIPSNLYEAYSFICLQANDYEKYVRTINKTIYLKEAMIRKYQLSQAEFADEEENDADYEIIIKLIKDSVLENRKQLDYYFNQIETKSFFVKLIYLENLAAINEKQKAKLLFEKLLKKSSIKEDLKQYMQDLFKD